MKHLLFLAAMTLATTTTHAARADDQGDGQKATLTFEQFKEACQNPARFHNQVAPTDIQVTCSDVQLKWVPLKQSVLSLSTSRVVVASIASDKYSMSELVANVDSAAQAMACPHFKQISETVQTVRAASCDDLLAFQGDATSYCADAVNTLRADNADAIVTADTGTVVDLCKASFVRR